MNTNDAKERKKQISKINLSEQSSKKGTVNIFSLLLLSFSITLECVYFALPELSGARLGSVQFSISSI